MSLDPVGAALLICQDKIRINRDDENPVISLNDEHLCHEPIEGADPCLFGSPDPPSSDVHRSR